MECFKKTANVNFINSFSSFNPKILFLEWLSEEFVRFYYTLLTNSPKTTARNKSESLLAFCDLM